MVSEHKWARRIRRSVLLGGLFVTCAGLAGSGHAGTTGNGTVLLLRSTLQGDVIPAFIGGRGNVSLEEYAAEVAHENVDLVDAATFEAMAADQFKAYDAIILGDPAVCPAEGAGKVDPAITNAAALAEAITGNVIVVGTDPVGQYMGAGTGTLNQNGLTLTQSAVDFAIADRGNTGAYINLSCYYKHSTSATRVAVLNPFGSFRVKGARCVNDAHLVATNPAFDPLVATPDVLSNWYCAGEEYFLAFPGSFSPAVIATNPPGVTLDGSLSFSDGSSGAPYVLARGAGLNPGGSAGDTTPPTINCDSADDHWHANDVSIACTAADDGSGLADPADANFNLTTNVAADSEDANAATDSHQVCDAAGNCATAGPIAGNQVDKKNPGLDCGAPDGLWHADDVSVSPCTAADGSGPAGAPPDANFNLTTNVAADSEDANAATDGHQVCDAGNCATADPIAGNQIDKKNPAINVLTPAEGAVYAQGQVVNANFGCADGGSGLAGCAGDVANGAAIDAATTGPHTLEVQADDLVGNHSSVTIHYTVAAAATNACKVEGEGRISKTTGFEFEAVSAPRARGEVTFVDKANRHSFAGKVTAVECARNGATLVGMGSDNGGRPVRFEVRITQGTERSGTFSIAFGSFTATGTAINAEISIRAIAVGRDR